MRQKVLILFLFLAGIIGCEKQYKDIQINSGKTIALTFDDGPDSKYTPLILDILKEKNIKATFFLIGNKMKKYPEITERIFKEGHCLANHTSNHVHRKGLQFRDVYKNVLKTERIIDSVSGGSLKLFRPPWGQITREQRDSLTLAGFKVILWDINSRDFSVKATANEIIERVISLAGDNKIILLHSADYAGKESRMNTVRALPKIIDLLKSKGYSFVTVNEIVNAGNRITLDAYPDSEQQPDQDVDEMSEIE
jgi:peptidoglycan/xylan/chitin deacetylase (PgdA/CDA1 family)